MEDGQFMQTELTGGLFGGNAVNVGIGNNVNAVAVAAAGGGSASLISHRPHHFHRYEPYTPHRPHLTAMPLPYLTHHQQQRLSYGKQSQMQLFQQYQNQPTSNQTHRPETPCSQSTSPAPIEGTHITHLYPEILTQIFSNLGVRDKGRAAQVCTSWRDAAYSKSVWKGVEARLHLRRPNQTLFPSLSRRGIKKVQILSWRRTIKDVIAGIPDLETLNLSGCYSITDASLCTAFYQDLPNLKILDLSLCKQITDTSLGRIANYLKNLETLKLAGCCNITNTSLWVIASKLKKLTRLDLRSCWQITDQGINHLAGLSKEKGPLSTTALPLKYLGLQDCQRLTDDALKYISQGLVTVESINLSFCVSVTDSGLKYLARMPNLRELNLRSCDNISDIGMAYLTEGGCTVTALDVSFCDKIGDQALSHLSQGLFHLRSLSLIHCQITDYGLLRIAKNLQELENLDIGQCHKITDKGLATIAEYLHNLTSIDLYGCTQLSADGLKAIEKKLPKSSKMNLVIWLKR